VVDLARPGIDKILFDTKDNQLQRDLKRAVDGHFAATGKRKTGDARMAAKAAFFLGGSWLLLAVLVMGLVPAWAGVPLALLLGVFLAGVGFNVGHDAIHGSFSHRPLVNRILAHSFDFAGASSFTWSTAHNFVHHTYTNIPGVDHDLDPGPFMSFYPRAKPAWIHRFQHLYAWPLYALTSLVWTFKKDFVQALAPDPRSGKRAPTGEILWMVLWKLIHLGVFLVLPLLVSGYAPWQVVVGYLLMHAAIGVTLATVFQLAHVVEETALPVPDDDNRVADSFAAHQLKTTSNFAPDSWFANFFCGGLNHQVEHHLFPRICHIHYPALAPLVREVARAHGVPYLEHPTFRAAFASHLRAMKTAGLPTPKAPAAAPLADSSAQPGMAPSVSGDGVLAVAGLAPPARAVA
jgi:linoleoyl-CoA desaturase